MLLALFTSMAIAQKVIIMKPVAIIRAEFKKHLPQQNNIQPLVANRSSRGVIRIKTPNKTIILKNDGEFKEYKYEGELKGYPIIVVHELEPNTEEYYLINKLSGTIDTLLDKPIFYKDNINLICVEGSGTDVHQRIQVAQILNNRLKTLYFIEPAGFVPISYVYWYNANTIFFDDNGKKFYKLTLE